MMNSRRRPLPWMLLATLMLGSTSGEHVSAEVNDATFMVDLPTESPSSDDLEIGHRCYRQGDYMGAVKAYYRQAQNQPKDASAWYYLGLGYLKLNQYNYASQVFYTAVNLSPREEVEYYLGLALHQSGEMQRAVQCLRGLLEKHDNNDLAWTLLGRSYESLGQVGHAKTCYTTALKINSNQGQAQFLLEHLDPKLPLANLELGSGRQKMATMASEELAMDSNSTKKVESAAMQADFDPVKVASQGRIPRSRVLSRISEEDSSRSTSELIPLLQCYHLSEDAPEKGLKATKVMEWEKSDTENSASKASPAPEMPVQVPNLNLQAEDL